MTSTMQLTPEQVGQVREIIQSYVLELGLNCDIGLAKNLGLDRAAGPKPKHVKYLSYLGAHLTTSARILEGAERGELPVDPDVISVFADCQAQARQTLDADSGVNCAGEEDAEAVGIAARHLAMVCGIREALRGHAYAADHAAAA